MMRTLLCIWNIFILDIGSTINEDDLQWRVNNDFSILPLWVGPTFMRPDDSAGS